MSFTDEDKKFLKENFATKDDLKSFATKDDLKSFATKDDLNKSLKTIKKSLKSIENKLDLTIRTFDRDFNYHHRRLTNLEEKVDIKPPPVVPPIN